jgi:hypothetical protein
MAWSQSSSDAHSASLTYRVNDCIPGSFYSILKNGKLLARVKSDRKGSLKFDGTVSKDAVDMLILRQ